MLPRCDRCSAAARVRILSGYQHGEPCYRLLCVACADDRDSAGPRSQNSFWLAAGIACATIGALADQISHGFAGVGWYQMTGISIGAVTVLAAPVLRRDFLFIVGLLVFCAAAGLDLIGLQGEPGIGWKQWILLLVGLILAFGVLLSRVGRPCFERTRTEGAACGG